MSKTYISPVDKAYGVDKIYIGDPNTSVARTVKKAYIGDPNGIARLVYLFAPWSYKQPVLNTTVTGQTGSISGYANFEFDEETGYFTLLGAKNTYDLASLYSSGNYVYTGAYHATGNHYLEAKKVSGVQSTPTYTYDVWAMAKDRVQDNVRYEENDTVVGYTSVTKGGDASGPTFSLSGYFNTEFYDKFEDRGGTYYTKPSKGPGYYEWTVTYNPSTWNYTQTYVHHYPVQSSETFATKQTTGWNANKDVYMANEVVGSKSTYTVDTYHIPAEEN